MVGVSLSGGMGGDFVGEIARDCGRGWLSNPALFFHATFFPLTSLLLTPLSINPSIYSILILNL